MAARYILSEITLLTVKQWNAPTIFCPPIGHRQERGDYQESWQPAEISEAAVREAQAIAQNLNEFELHLRAVLGLPVPKIEQLGASASAVILASEQSDSIYFEGVADALSEPDVDVRLFGKPDSRPFRRMGVALAKASNIEEAREKATRAASKVKIVR